MSDGLNGVLGSPALPLEGTFDGPVVRGYSAYAIAVQNGFVGTIEEWLESLKGEKGDKGNSGDKGDPGEQGDPGPKGDKGDPGTDGDDGVGIASIELDPDYGLRITLTDGSIYATSSVRGPQGEPGVGIRNIQMNSDYTITFTLTNGGSYTTPPARGAKGEQGDPGPKGEKGDKGDPGESFSIHICSTSEYDQQTGIPTIQNPDPKVLYLVPSAAGMPPDLFVEWMYVANTWEIFGTATVDISTKADKVVNATSGNFAELDSNGNLVDSGHKHSDYLTQHQDITGKADKVTGATSGNLAGLDSNGNLYDSGSKPSDFLTQHQDITGKADKVQNATSGNFASLDSNGNLTDSGHSFTEINQELTSVKSDLSDLSHAVDDKYEKPSGGIPASDLADDVIPDLTDYVKNTDYANENNAGIVKSSTYYGTRMLPNGAIGIYRALSTGIKAGIDDYRPIVPYVQDASTFYGLAKAAGDTTQSASSNTVGNYTETAQSKIHEMLDAPVTVSGTTPTITGKAGIRYVCGEVSTLSITPPASGIIDVVFTSGSTPTVLTVPSTVKFPEWFDPTSLVANTTYEINIADGVYGAVMAWT